MLKPANAKRSEAIYYRLIALWVLCEAVLGGIIHGFRIPVSGLVVGSSAIICISLIAFFKPEKGAIIKATVIVTIFKMMLSPQAPLTAYIAVFFQGLMGELLFWNRRNFRIATVAFSVIALLESAFQRILVVTIVYGNDIWTATNQFIFRLFPDSYGTNFSYIFATAYVVAHLIAGILIGLVAGWIPFRYKQWERPNLKGVPVQDLLSRNTRTKRIKIFLILIWFLLVLLLLQSNYGPGRPFLPADVTTRILVRSVIIVISWIVIISPLLRHVLYKWLEKKKHRSAKDISYLSSLLPDIRNIVVNSWQQSGGKRKILRFGKMMLAEILNGDAAKAKVYILTGEIASGKTTSLLQLVKKRKNVSGILSPVDNYGKRYFLDIERNERFEMLADDNDPDSLSVGRYKFSRDAFRRAAHTIRNIGNSTSLVIIDEIGPLELRKEGFYEEIKHLLSNSQDILLVVRRSLVENVMEFFDIPGAIVVQVEEVEKIFSKEKPAMPQ